jgi:hypothetical protein
VLSWCNSQLFCHQSSGQSRTFSRSRCESHSTMQNWLFGLPGWILCEQSPWWWVKFLNLLFTYLTFFGLGEFMLSCMTHAFLPKIMSNHFQGLCSTFSEICTKFDDVSLSDPSQNCIMTPNKRM